MHVVLISVGIFQEYLITNMKQLLLLGCNVTVITDEKYLSKLSQWSNQIETINADHLELDWDFENRCALSKTFRNGFLRHCSKRLFLLHAYMKKYGRTECWHLENDVLLYKKLATPLKRNKLHLAMDSAIRCIPSILYIPHHQVMEMLLAQYDYPLGDMFNLGKFFNTHRKHCCSFPIISPSTNTSELPILSENYDDFHCIFDAAAIGQYVGGIDPRNDWSGPKGPGLVSPDCVIKYNRFSFVWLETSSGFWSPHLQNGLELYPIVNLHLHCKELDKFTAVDPQNTETIFRSFIPITGERIQSLCDQYIGTLETFANNPKMESQKNKQHMLSDKSHWINPSLLFCYTYHLNYFPHLINLLQKCANPFVLILHNSDEALTQGHVYHLFRNVPKLRHIASQNSEVIHERVLNLPIGIANSMWPHGNIQILQTVMQEGIKKDKNVYFYFNCDTAPAIRNHCRRVVEAKGVPWSGPGKLFTDYLRLLAKHRWCICPEGNGHDTHRLWECLYLGVMPIVLRTPFSEALSRDYPMVMLDRWEDLDITALPTCPLASKSSLCMGSVGSKLGQLVQ